MVPCADGAHPSDVAVDAVKDFFGDQFDLEAAIVHSTSWRYTGRVVLTYLVIVGFDALAPVEDRVAEFIDIGRFVAARGDHLAPPTRLENEAIIAHALDHLALLILTDPSIQQNLTPTWLGILHRRRPRPAGHVAVTPLYEQLNQFLAGFWDDSPLPPGSSMVEVSLMPDGDGTLVKLRHSGLPPDQVAVHAQGWDGMFIRLVTVASGKDPGDSTVMG